MVTLLFAWSLTQPAGAQSTDGPATSTSAEDRSLAIPGRRPGDKRRRDRRLPPGTHEGPVVRPPPAQVKIRAPGSSSIRARAYRAYRDEYLAIRRSSRYVTNIPYQWGSWGYGPPRMGMWGFNSFGPGVAYRMDRLGVVQGHEWLDAPAVLGALGDTGAEQNLRRKVRRNRNAATFMQAVAVLGVGGIVTGLIGADRATNLDHLRNWQRVTAGGIGLTIGGIIMSAIPSSRANNLRSDITRTVEVHELRRRIEDHNATLASELGISPEMAVRLESR